MRLVSTLRRGFLGGGLPALALLSFADGAQAQTAGTQPADPTEIVVTAQKRAERILDVPISITAISGNQLEKTARVTVTDALRLVPNVVLNDQGQLRRGDVAIRGISSDVNNVGTEPSIGTFVDGVYQGRATTLNGDLMDLQRIEVLRGPQGTLYGKNTTGGAINIITRDPGAQADGELAVDVGNYSYQRVRFTASTPIAGDKLAIRITGTESTRDGTVRDTFRNRDLSDLDRRAARIVLLAKPTDALTVRFSADYSHDENQVGTVIATLGGNAGIAPIAAALGKVVTAPPLSARTTAMDATQLARRQIWGTGLQADYRFDGGYTLTSVTGYRGFSYKDQGNDSDYTQLSLVTSGLREVQQQLSQELRIASPAEDRLRFTGGLYFYKQIFKGDQRAATGADFTSLAVALSGGLVRIPDGSPAPALVHTNTESKAAFAQATYDLTSQLKLTAGLRVTNEQKDLSHDQSRVFPALALLGFPPPIAPFTRSIGETNWSPMATLQYQPNRDWMAYATFSKGYKSGGFSTGLLNTANDVVFRPEEAKNYEVGVKATVVPNKVTASLSAFYLDYTDLQVSVFQTNRFIVTNAAAAKSRGFEFELQANPDPNLTLQFAAGYLDATYDNFKNAPCPANSGASVCNLTGRPLRNAPKWTLSAGAEYTHELPGTNFEGFGAFDMTYATKQYFTLEDDPDLTQGSNFLVNGRVGARTRDGKYELSMWVRNLFDRTYATGGNTTTPFSATKVKFLGDPRFFGASFKVRL